MRDVATAQAVQRRLQTLQFDWASESVREVLGPDRGHGERGGRAVSVGAAPVHRGRDGAGPLGDGGLDGGVPLGARAAGHARRLSAAAPRTDGAPGPGRFPLPPAHPPEHAAPAAAGGARAGERRGRRECRAASGPRGPAALVPRQLKMIIEPWARLRVAAACRPSHTCRSRANGLSSYGIGSGRLFQRGGPVRRGGCGRRVGRIYADRGRHELQLPQQALRGAERAAAREELLVGQRVRKSTGT